MSRHIVLLLFTLFLTAFQSFSQDAVSDGVLRFSVTSKRGETVSGLKAEDFSVRLAGQIHPISFLAQADEPVSVGILIDTSGSIDQKHLSVILRAASDFVDGIRRDHEFFVVEFSDTAQLVADFSTNRQSIKGAISSLSSVKSLGNTAIVSSIYAGLIKIAGSKYQKKALIVFTDGMDNSTADYAKLRVKMREWCVPVYFVGLKPPHLESLSALGAQAKVVVQDVIDTCGGAMNFVEKPEYLGNASVGFAKEIEEQYLIGFKLDGGASGRSRSGWQKLDLTVELSGVANFVGKPVIKVRRGYYFPKTDSK